MSTVKIGLILLGALIAGVGSMRAQEWSPGGYLNAYGGANLMDDITVKAAGVSGKVSPEAGYRAGLGIGYEFYQWFGVEFDTGFQANDLHDAPATTIKAMPLLLNAMFRFRNSTRIIPYAGIGAGGVVSTVNSPLGADINLVFGYQATAGVEYELTPQFRVGVLYKFFSVPEQDYTIAHTKFTVSDVHSHFIGANLSWSF